ncbi:nitroreductase [uncultured Desulfovibrio sp.]|uniref:nitroreductase n=1 Tax=uncultured Desulfovibrio sp. TaxID=167968 RepID=UPI002606FFA2|nr:nitroreductase [uncultured Desulfovibrio sp.]
MDAVLEAMKTRRSCRKFRPDMVPDDLLQKIAEAGTYAASGMGKQPCRIIVVKDKAVRDQLSSMNAGIMGVNSDPFYGAPVCMVVLADQARPTYVYDGSLVIGNLMLAAHALGLGSCWIHRAREEFKSDAGKALLRAWGIDGNYEGIGHCVIGYPAAAPAKAAPRKPDFVKFV